MKTPDKKEKAEALRYLTFRLDADLYGIEVGQVKEVLDAFQLTRIPQTDPCILGVLNLRGHVVPVLDLRQRFGMEMSARTRESCIIVVELRHDGQTGTAGILTDSVVEVLDLAEEQIEPPPRLGDMMHSDCITGVGQNDDASMILLLDTERVFHGEGSAPPGDSEAA